MLDRRIAAADVRRVIESSEVVARYLDDRLGRRFGAGAMVARLRSRAH
jgi:hypothetical protein